MTSSSIDSWTREAESLETSKNLLYFKQLVGLKFDKRRLASLESRTKTHYTRYLRSRGREEDGQRGLFLMSVAAVGMAVTYKQLLKLYDARTTKVVSREFEFGGAPVNWGSWRQFAASTDDSAARKTVFDDFVGKSSILAPLIQKRFETYRTLVAQFGTDPLSAYLEHEGISYDRLSAMVQRLGELARAPFRDSLKGYSAEIIGRPAEYYDDYYFFRSRVFRRYAKSLPTKEKPIGKIVKTMRRMGLDASKIVVDDVGPRGEERLRLLLRNQDPSGRPHLVQEGEPPRGLLIRVSRIRARYPLLLDRPARQLLGQVRGGEWRRRDLLDLLRGAHP